MTRFSNSQLWRHRCIVVVLFLVFAALAWRMFSLMVLQRNFLLSQGNARSLRVIDIPVYRGTIFDRNGEALAISTPVDAVAANPRELDLKDARLEQLASLLSISYEELMSRLAASRQREFIYLKRALEPALARQIEALKIPGIFMQREYKRYYPSGEIAVHVVGFTNIDDKGQEGLELAYDDWLRGEPGKRRVFKDRLGHVVEDVKLLQSARPGKDLMLSLDKRIQYAAYRELQEAMHKYQALSGSVVVLDVETGEILAMANQPSFNPNQRPRQHTSDYRNRAVTDMFEPGSTMKPFAVALALASGNYEPHTLVDTSPGWINLDGNRVRDEHPLGVTDVTTILQRSSNVGIAKLVLSLPADSLWALFNRIGFGAVTVSGFPGESPGKLLKRDKWMPFTLATLSFGYGMSVTALQLAQAYAMLARDGVKYPVSFLRQDGSPAGERILKPNVAQTILQMLESVLENGGTAPRARVNGYRVTGKTGTVRMLGPQGYLHDHHIAIFVGTAPASHPRLVVAVVINDPLKVSYYGGWVAGPVFSKVMGRALRILDIPPDRLPAAANAA